MKEGVSPGAVAEAEELSQEEGEGELCPQALVVAGPAVFWLASGGLQQKSGIVWFQHTPVVPFSLRSTEVSPLLRSFPDSPGHLVIVDFVWDIIKVFSMVTCCVSL